MLAGVGVQVYVLAPLTVKLVLCPLQIVGGVEVILIVARVFTVTVAVADEAVAQPLASVPFKLYVVVTVGLTVTELAELVNPEGVEVQA